MEYPMSGQMNLRGKRTRCWWCGRKLQLPHFAIVVLQGEEHVVHKQCRDEMELKPITAQPPNHN
jgi:hypothetical protein